MNLTITEKIKSDEILKKIISNFDNEIYLVGGAVRDFITGKTAYDRDLIVMDKCAREFSLKIAEFFNAVFVPLDEENKIYRIVMPDKINYLDITNPIENSLEKDLMRRDLTINAVAVNLKTFETVDLCGGISDIQNRCINYINEQNFEDDPLRILRAYRFQAQLGFNLSPETVNAVIKYLSLIHKPAKERVQYEIMHLFDGDYAHKALINMNKTWLLEEIFPFVKELKQVPPNSHHHLGLLEHSIETVKQVTDLYKQSSNDVKDHLEKIDFGGYSRLAHLRLAAFLHDIGKFSTWTIEKDTGRHRFIKHDDIGAKIAFKILKQMCFSNKQTDYISDMIKYHIYPSQVMSAPEVNDKTMMRYIRKLENNSIDAVILAKADRLSARGPEITDEIVEKNIDSLNRLLKFYIDIKDTLKPLPVLLDGNDVMKILGINPSPVLGKVMNAMHEAQISGDISEKDEAIEFVKNFYKNS